MCKICTGCSLQQFALRKKPENSTFIVSSMGQSNKLWPVLTMETRQLNDGCRFIYPYRERTPRQNIK